MKPFTWAVIDRRDGNEVARHAAREDAESHAERLNGADPAKPFRVCEIEVDRWALNTLGKERVS